MEKKNKIIVYRDWIEIFEPLEDAEAGKLIKHFFRYVNDQNPESPDRLTGLLFDGSIKPTLKRDLQSWKQQQERNKINGSNGGRPKKEKPKETEKTQSVISEPTQTHSNPKKGVKDNVKDKDILFNIFWSKYPNKTGKKPAREKFNRLTDQEKQTIINTVDAFAAYKPFETYTHPHATTYLNQRRWEDVLPAPQKQEPVVPREVWHVAKQIPAELERLCIKYSLTKEQFISLYK